LYDPTGTCPSTKSTLPPATHSKETPQEAASRDFYNNPKNLLKSHNFETDANIDPFVLQRLMETKTYTEAQKKVDADNRVYLDYMCHHAMYVEQLRKNPRSYLNWFFKGVQHQIAGVQLGDCTTIAGGMCCARVGVIGCGGMILVSWLFCWWCDVCLHVSILSTT